MKEWDTKLSKCKSSKLGSVLCSVSPSKISVNDLIVATELVCDNLPNSKATVLRAEIAGVSRTTKLRKSNITAEKQQASKDLQQEKSIVHQADKGKATVVMDASEYDSKVKDMLSDRIWKFNQWKILPRSTCIRRSKHGKWV